MKFIKKAIIALLVISISTSCSKTFDTFLSSPNSPTPASADVDLYFNTVQQQFNGFYQSCSDYGAALSRQQNWGGPLYRNAYSPTSFDGIWQTAYTDIINNANAMIPLAEAQKKYIQAGAAKILKAYTVGTLVDDFGDVPYSQSELGLVNPNPAADPGASIYTAILALLDDAIADLAKTGAAAVPTDLYYAGSAANWTTLAKTLKLKFLMQTRLVDPTATAKIQALITANDLILTSAKDFQFKYGTSLTPDSRHPHYGADYVASGGEGEYLSNYFMWDVTAQKYGGVTKVPVATATATSGDPRTRYYFYRQSLNYAWASSQSAPCYVNSAFGNNNPPAWYKDYPTYYPYCVIGSGYLGRDHGDNSGAPPDANYRTANGIYPAGGQFDANQGAATTLSMGGLGAGISPIWLSSFTYFLEAEAVSTLGVTAPGGTARTLLNLGVTASVTKVIGFPTTVNVTPSATYALTTTSTLVTNYYAQVLANYDAATTGTAKLNIIMNEYYIAAFGNGIEAYNNLRRTGMPLILQPAVAVPNPGFFMRSFFYPNVYESRNLKALPQKTPGDAVQKVFWDNNPDNFIP